MSGRGQPETVSPPDLVRGDHSNQLDSAVGSAYLRGVAFFPGARDTVDALGIGDHFEVVVHGGIDAPYKPDPEPFHLALAQLGAPPDRASDPDPEPHHVVDSMHHVAAEPWV